MAARYLNLVIRRDQETPLPVLDRLFTKEVDWQFAYAWYCCPPFGTPEQAKAMYRNPASGQRIESP